MNTCHHAMGGRRHPIPTLSLYLQLSRRMLIRSGHGKRFCWHIALDWIQWGTLSTIITDLAMAWSYHDVQYWTCVTLPRVVGGTQYPPCCCNCSTVGWSFVVVRPSDSVDIFALDWMQWSTLSIVIDDLALASSRSSVMDICCPTRGCTRHPIPNLVATLLL